MGSLGITKMEYVKNNYLNQTYKEMAKELNVSRDTIAHTCSKLQLGKINLFSKTDVLHLIKEKYRLEGRATMYERALEYHAKKHFGSWKNALRAANVPFNNQKFLPEDASTLTPNLAYIVGVVCGDGCLHFKGNAGYIRLCSKDKEFIFIFQEAMKKWVELEAKIYVDKKGYFHVAFGSFNAATIIKVWMEEIESVFLTAPPEEQFAFLKGLYDSEGCINIYKNYGKIIFSNTNKKIIDVVEQILFQHDVSFIRQARKSEMYSTGRLYTLVIGRKEGLQFFKNNVGFSIKRKQDQLEEVCLPSIPS